MSQQLQKPPLPNQTLTSFPYQVSFTYSEIGRHIPSSKRALIWRFGLADKSSLERGERGIACCGDEHTVAAVWSVRSGKLRITVDDKLIPVHLNQDVVGDQEVTTPVSSKSSQNMKKAVDIAWTLQLSDQGSSSLHHDDPSSADNTLQLQFLGHATMPVHTHKQYDLLVDGRSFFKLPKLQYVGVSAYVYSSKPGTTMIGAQPTAVSSMGRPIPPPLSYIESIEAPMSPLEDDAYLKEALRRSQEGSWRNRRLHEEEEKIEVDREMDQRRRLRNHSGASNGESLSLDGIEPLSGHRRK